MCKDKEFHNFGAARLKALPPKNSTDHNSAEDDLKEYTNEEDLTDNEVPNYEELCVLEAIIYSEHDNEEEATAAEKELEIYDQKYVS